MGRRLPDGRAQESGNAMPDSDRATLKMYPFSPIRGRLLAASSEHPLIGERRVCTTGYFSMVAVDADGRPVRVPRLLLPDAQAEEEWKVGEEIRRVIDARRNR